MTADAWSAPSPGPFAAPAAVPVRRSGRRLLNDLEVVAMVWRRDLLRFSRNRLRVLTSIAQPALFLFVLGTGLSAALPEGSGKVDFRTFIFPGVLAMTVLFPAIFAAMTIVFDRQEGFLREMLVAPARRSAVIVGKCLGGASIATVQGIMMLLLAPLVHVPYSWTLLVVLAELVLTALMVTALGLFVASRMDQVESFQVLIQVLVLPIFFLSGAMFPVRRLPPWLGALTRLDPLSYAVDPMRRAVFQSINAPPASVHNLNPGLSWGGWRIPTLVELGVVTLVGAALLAMAIVRFSRPD